ncbi:hypothetical protein V5799_032964 [Amblyomma americanum]|uniref:Uncharacterized protein n=1 Tax=Amblyomma americanum TaxID=6943 RepID=A0AAQ4DPN5_AMBAM
MTIGLRLFFAPDSCSAPAKQADWELHPSTCQRCWRTTNSRMREFQAYCSGGKSCEVPTRRPVLPALEIAEQPSLSLPGVWMALP